MIFHRAKGKGSDGIAFRRGNFKIIIYWQDNETRLFDLSKDISEEHNISSQYPELVDQMLKDAKA